MWSCPEKPIPEWQIKEEHLRVLKRAVDDADEGLNNPKEIFAALEYLKNQSIHAGGFIMFREAIVRNDPGLLRRALETIKKHLGI